MSKYFFKTNINCQGCIDKVTPFINKAGDHFKWEVDTKNRNKLLVVEGSESTVKQVIELVKEAGFNIEQYEEL